MNINMKITWTNFIGAVGFLYAVFNLSENAEILMYSTVLILGRQVIPEIGHVAESIAKIINAKKGIES